MHSDNPVRRLVLVKDAIRNVYELNSKESGFPQLEPNCPPEDKLGLTLCMLRAFGKSNWPLIHKCVGAYPELSKWTGTGNSYSISNSNSEQIRNHALDLSRQEISADIFHLNSGEVALEDKPRVKDSILRKLKRLAPGSCTGIGAMQTESGAVVTKPEEIVQALRSHWRGVFRRKEVRTQGLQIWMEELFIKDENGVFITNLPASGASCWKITGKQVALAIRCAKNSAPGPDGIPSEAWRALQEFGISVLAPVAMALCCSDYKTLLREAYADRAGENLHDFNNSLLCCLPKKPHGSCPNVGEFYRGEDTRPLALVNVDNRIIANAARYAWEPQLNSFISQEQQGFLKGRSMLNNLIDIDYDAMVVN